MPAGRQSARPPAALATSRPRADRHRGRPTLRDVALDAGVSTSTASLVFSGNGPVASKTAERVRASASRLGYAGPDPLASSLRHGRAGVVGVLVEGRLLYAFRDPFAVSVLDGVATVLDSVPTGMLLLAQEPGGHDRTVGQLATMALDAVVFSLCGPDDNPVVDHLAARGIPMIGAGSPGDPRVTQVTIDEAGATAGVVQHLQGHGHSRVAMVAMPLAPLARTQPMDEDMLRASAYADARERVLGFRSVAGPDAPVVQGAEPDVDSGRVAAGLLLDQPHASRPTAVVAQSDLLAVGVVLAAEERGLRVPEDLSVAGFDGVELPWFGRALTTVDQSGQAKGRQLGELAAAALRGEPVHDVRMPTRLRVGATTGPAPTRPRPAQG